MAKRKAAKARKTTPTVSISGHLKKPLASLLKQARALKGKVAEDKELSALIKSLETLEASAASNCPVQSWQRKFTLAAKSTKKR